MAAQVTMVNMAASSDASCKQCAHAQLRLQEGQPGMVCRRNPPKPQGIAIPTAGGLQIQAITLWPTVADSDWCAEFCPNPVSTLSN